MSIYDDEIEESTIVLESSSAFINFFILATGSGWVLKSGMLLSTLNQRDMTEFVYIYIYIHMYARDQLHER